MAACRVVAGVLPDAHPCGGGCELTGQLPTTRAHGALAAQAAKAVSTVCMAQSSSGEQLGNPTHTHRVAVSVCGHFMLVASRMAAPCHTRRQACAATQPVRDARAGSCIGFKEPPLSHAANTRLGVLVHAPACRSRAPAPQYPWTPGTRSRGLRSPGPLRIYVPPPARSGASWSTSQGRQHAVEPCRPEHTRAPGGLGRERTRPYSSSSSSSSSSSAPSSSASRFRFGREGPAQRAPRSLRAEPAMSRVAAGGRLGIWGCC